MDKVQRFTITKVIKQESRNNYYSVFLANSSNELNVVCKGPYIAAQKGQTVFLNGEQADKHFAYRAKVGLNLTSRREAELYGKHVFGLSDSESKRLTFSTGAHTFDAIDNFLENLPNHSSIPEEKREAISGKVGQFRPIHELLIRLAQKGLFVKSVLEACEKEGNGWLKNIKANPYQLSEHKAIPFFKLDRLVLKNTNIKEDDERRLNAAFLEAARKLEHEGHSVIQVESIEKNLRHLEYDQGVLYRWLNEQKYYPLRELGKNEYALFIDKLVDLEKSAAKNLVERTKTPINTKSIEVYESLDNVNANELQKWGIVHSLINPITALTGGPGTGKTYVMERIAELMSAMAEKEKKHTKVAIMAPTGIATELLESRVKFNSEYIKCEFATLHKALGWGSRDGENILADVDFAIVDEYGMAGIDLHEEFLRKLNPNCRLLMVGDYNQLPSVSPGAVLRDLVKSKVVPHIHLTEVRRTGKDSDIPIFADKVIKKEIIDVSEWTRDKDVTFVNCVNEQDIHAAINEILTSGIKEFGFSLDDVAILSPGRQHSLGVVDLNEECRKIFNPKGRVLKIMGKNLATGDRVLQTKPNRKTGIVNGQEGVIEKIDMGQNHLPEVTVNFGHKVVTFTNKDLWQLEPSFVKTVHKSQGSQYPCVIMPLSESQHKFLLQNPTVFTGITRASKKVFILGSEHALNYAIQNNTMSERCTFTKQALLEEEKKSAKPKVDEVKFSI